MDAARVPAEDVWFDIDVNGRWHGSSWRPRDADQRGNGPEVTVVNGRCDQVIMDRYPS